MSSTAVLLLGLLPVAVFVMWPLFSGDADDTAAPLPADDAAALERKKLSAYAAIKEAEFDQRTGKLSAEDYDQLVARYKGQALEAIAELERRGESATASEPPARRAGREPKRRFCPACGSRTGHAAKFCSGCGHALLARAS